MADSKYSALSDGGAIQPGDIFAVDRAGSSLRVLAPGADGWIDDTAETWTYASGSGGGTATFTVSGDVTAKYTPGTRIKLTQTTVKYFVVVSSSVSSGTTTVTITAGSDYTLANAAISANYHSYMTNPQGYPSWFNYTPTVVGWSGSPTKSGRFSVVGRICVVAVNVSGTSNSTTTTISLPITVSASEVAMAAAFRATDNGTPSATPGRAITGAGATVITCTKDWAGNAFTNSGTKAVDNLTGLVYEI